MFWKNNKLKESSITNKLIFLYTCSTFALLVAIAAILYWTLTEAMLTACEQYLIDEVHIIKSILQKHPDNLSLISQEVNGVPIELTDASYHYYIRLYDEHGETVMQTPTMPSELQNKVFPPVENNSPLSPFSLWHAPHTQKTSYLLVSAPISYQAEGKPKLYLQAALDMTYQQQLIDTFFNKALIALPFSFIGVVLLGKLLAQNSLKRLYDLAKITEKITVNSLSELIQMGGWPKELKPLATAFNTMLTNINKAFTRLSSCTTELAHELRTPINNLMGQTEIALAETKSPEEYQRLLSSNLEEYQRMKRLIDNIIFIARAENIKTSLKFTQILFNKELRKITDYHTILADEKNITIVTKLESTTGRSLQVEPVLFQRAVSNILMNALQHTPVAGKITISSNLTKKYIKLSIKDTGRGIPPEHLPYVLERFYSIDSKHEGIGLGLAMVKTIMQLHKGKISISSQINRGTKVKLYFPLNKESKL